MPSEDQLGKLYNLKRDRGSGWEKPYSYQKIDPSPLFCVFRDTKSCLFVA